jgi:16S rRNA (uracil1498-N3)-methyltransferase
MIRRVHLPQLWIGTIALPAAEAHHVRDVLRLEEGNALELFDSAGSTAVGVIKHLNPANVVVTVESIQTGMAGSGVTVAAAIPKGDRADWMVEKLSELGVARFIPLAAERSVTLPGGKNKLQRWERIAIEAAKQSRRVGTMSIAPVTLLKDLVKTADIGWYLSTTANAMPVGEAVGKATDFPTLLIGPEGGWCDLEMQQMDDARFQAVRLTPTILRVETAAVTAAALVLCMVMPEQRNA